MEIRSWGYEILILEKHEGIGFNTRFLDDAVVLITCPVANEAEYH